MEEIIVTLREASEILRRPWEGLRRLVIDAKKRGELRVVTRGWFKTEYFRLTDLQTLDANHPRRKGRHWWL